MVTGTGGAGLGEQVIKALRLAPSPYHVIAADIVPRNVGSTLADESCLLPLASDPSYMEALCAAVEKLHPAVVIPSSEPELRRVSAERERLERLGILLPIQPADVIARCSDKAATHTFLAQAGFDQPMFRTVASEDDVDDIDFFPCVLKPATGGSGSANVYLAQDAAELRDLARYSLAAGGSLLVEEYVGRADTEFTVGVLHDLDGRLVHSIAIHRSILGGLSNKIRVANRTGRYELGEILAISSGVSQGDIGPFRHVAAECERVADAVGSRGPLNVQCRVHDDRIMVFEINPRFSGTTALRALAGFNEPDLLIRLHLLDESIERPFPYQSGTVLRGLSEVFFPDGPS